MPYQAPTRNALRDSIARDLHDPNNKAFTSVEIDDLIMLGVAELNRLVPKEYRVDIPLSDGTFTYLLDATVDDLFRVEMWRGQAFAGLLPRADPDYPASGWDFFQNILRLPTGVIFDDATDTLAVWGYENREPPVDDDEVVDINHEGELVIRSYAQFTCFQRLIASRSLYQQWQTAAGATDVSPTQLLGMAQVYANEWRTLRGRVRRLRRMS
jgi:hypothetical protein